MTTTPNRQPNTFTEAVKIRHVDLIHAARLGLAFRAEDRLGVAAVLDNILQAANDSGDDAAATGLILGLGRILGLHVGALDEETGGMGTKGLQHLIAEATLKIESGNTK
ncbi:hypothetical protein QFZ40_001259 [Arthrobacter pascens]|uniref:hypothetical protein n=1 Tax=Arthrobacter pascens TaxID=1677 RepID=UPI0027850D1E|nr:hypothetical protein [Arthrobacter pascens]MDQ0633350.1 hypothetical protein [Arthrobacter pascens]